VDSVLQEELMENWKKAYLELKREMWKTRRPSLKQYAKKRSQSFGDLTTVLPSTSVTAAVTLLSSSTSCLSLFDSSSTSSSTTIKRKGSNGDDREKKKRKKGTNASSNNSNGTNISSNHSGSGGDNSDGDHEDEGDSLADFNRAKRKYFSQFDDVSLFVEEVEG